jgi:hypothetical protein
LWRRYFGHATRRWNLLCQQRQIHRRLRPRLRQQRRQNSNVGYSPPHRSHVQPGRGLPFHLVASASPAQNRAVDRSQAATDRGRRSRAARPPSQSGDARQTGSTLGVFFVTVLIVGVLRLQLCGRRLHPYWRQHNIAGVAADRLPVHEHIHHVAVVSALFGILMLVAAYRTGNLTAWGRLAILGGISVLLSAILADIAATRLMAEAAAR